jgi:hypothetical protein
VRLGTEARGGLFLLVRLFMLLLKTSVEVEVEAGQY